MNIDVQPGALEGLAACRLTTALDTTPGAARQAELAVEGLAKVGAGNPVLTGGRGGQEMLLVKLFGATPDSPPTRSNTMLGC
jgi:hypothetical protein